MRLNAFLTANRTKDLVALWSPRIQDMIQLCSVLGTEHTLRIFETYKQEDENGTGNQICKLWYLRNFKRGESMRHLIGFFGHRQRKIGFEKAKYYDRRKLYGK